MTDRVARVYLARWCGRDVTDRVYLARWCGRDVAEDVAFTVCMVLQVSRMRCAAPSPGQHAPSRLEVVQEVRRGGVFLSPSFAFLSAIGSRSGAQKMRCTMVTFPGSLSGQRRRCQAAFDRNCAFAGGW